MLVAHMSVKDDFRFPAQAMSYALYCFYICCTDCNASILLLLLAIVDFVRSYRMDLFISYNSSITWSLLLLALSAMTAVYSRTIRCGSVSTLPVVADVPEASLHFKRRRLSMSTSSIDDAVGLSSANTDDHPDISIEEAFGHASRKDPRHIDAFAEEMTTPLTSILVGTQLLQNDGALTDDQRQIVTRVTCAAEMAMMTCRKTVNVFGRPSIAPDNVPVRIADVCDRCITLFREFETPKLKFIYRLDGDVPTVVVADEKLVWDILMNLMSNAREYTRKGFVELSVSVESSAEGDGAGKYLHVRVRDTGAGVDAEAVPSLFAPFSSQPPGRNPGSGLGLYSCRLKARAMGGDVGYDPVTAGSPRGSIFWFKVPYGVYEGRCPSSAAHHPILGEDAVAEKDRPPFCVFKCLRILIIDADIVLMSMLKKLLESDGALVDIVNGSDARSVLDGGGYHCILFDPAFASEVRGFLDDLPPGRSAGVFTCVCSGVAASPDGVEGDRSSFEFDHFQSKPIDKTAVRIAMRKCITKLGLDRIMIIEDDRTVGRMMLRIADEMGLDARLLVDGSDALDVLRESNTDYLAILVDLNMPLVGGTAFVEEALAMYASPDRPSANDPYICIVTGESRATAVPGAHNIFFKPFGYAQFERVVDCAIAHRRETTSMSPAKLNAEVNV
jgi:signal transduction histidine kinase/DNA-binding response OmpR family regulator